MNDKNCSSLQCLTYISKEMSGFSRVTFVNQFKCYFLYFIGKQILMRQSTYFLPRYILHNIIPMVLHKELLLSLSGRELWFYSYFFVGLHPWRIISTESRLTGSLNIRFKRTDYQETSRTSYYSFGGRSLAYYPSKHEGDCYPYVKDWAALKTGYKTI